MSLDLQQTIAFTHFIVTMIRMTRDLIATNNQGCSFLDRGDGRSALQCFRIVLTSFRTVLQEKQQQTGEITASPMLIPLTLEGIRALQDSFSLLLEGGNRQEGFVLHDTAFRMCEDMRFCSQDLLDAQFHMVITLFNLGLTFHLSGRQQKRHFPSSSPPNSLLQARALYDKSLQLLQDCLRTSSSCGQGGMNNPTCTNNAFVDLIHSALLNNTAVLCCVDLFDDHAGSQLDARNVNFVRHFANVIESIQGHHHTGAYYSLLQVPLRAFSNNASRLSDIFFCGSAAAAA